jgi:hypothetical protein
LFTRSDVEVGWSEATGRALVAKELAAEPDVSPNQLPGLFITPLRRRADQFDLPLPFEVTQAKGGKLRQWEDFGGVASRMTRVLESAAPRSVRS